MYLKAPERITAAVNAGDYGLYLGGAGINLAFKGILNQADLRTPLMRYMHTCLLAKAEASPGELVCLDLFDPNRRYGYPEGDYLRYVE